MSQRKAPASPVAGRHCPAGLEGPAAPPKRQEWDGNRAGDGKTKLADQWVPYAALGTVIFVSCFTLGILGRGDVQIAGPPMAVAIGYMGFAILDRQLVLGLLALAMAAVVVAVLALDPGHPYSVQSFVTGTGTFLAGLALRRAERPGGVTA